MKNYKFLTLFVFISSLVLVQGCSTLFGKQGVFRGKDKDYLKSGSLKEMSVPEGMETKPIEPLYPLPDSTATDEFGDPIPLQEYEVTRPVSAKSETTEVGVKIQKLGDYRWIYLNAPPSQIWPRTQSYFSNENIRVVRNRSQGGND